MMDHTSYSSSMTVMPGRGQGETVIMIDMHVQFSLEMFLGHYCITSQETRLTRFYYISTLHT